MKKVVCLLLCAIQCICIYGFGLIKFVNDKRCIPAYASSTSKEVIDSICIRNKEYDGVIVHFHNNRVYISTDVYNDHLDYWFDLCDVRLYVSDDAVINLFSDCDIDSLTYARCLERKIMVHGVMESVNKLYKGCTYKIDNMKNNWIHLYDIPTYNGTEHDVYLSGWVKWDQLYKVSSYPWLVKD